MNRTALFEHFPLFAYSFIGSKYNLFVSISHFNVTFPTITYSCGYGNSKLFLVISLQDRFSF